MAVTLEYALALHRSGRLAEAELAYRNILARTPKNAEALANLGLLLAQRGCLEDGRAMLAESVLCAPLVPMAQFNLGSVLLALERYEEAIKSLSAAVALSPRLVDAHFSIGNALLALGRPEEAAEAFRTASTLAPENVEILLNLGTALQQLGRIGDALGACERALLVAPRHPGALNNRGNALRILGRLDDALSDFDNAIAVEPGYVIAHFNRATVLKDLRRFDEALTECRKILGFAPSYAPAAHLQGTILLELGECDEALGAFDRALKLQPTMAEAFHGRIGALLKLSRWEEALLASDIAITAEPNSAIAHNNHGVALLRFRRYEEAAAAFQQAIALEPENSKLYLNRGGLYYQQELFDDALADAQKALDISPDLAAGRDFRFCVAAHLCDWRFRASDVEAVIGHFRAGEEVEPFPLLYAVDDPALHLAVARKAAGRRKETLTRTTVSPRKRLRVAYISADFRDHPVSYQAVELFELHNRARVETFGISLWPQPQGAMSDRMRRAFDHFIEAFDRSDYQIARRLADLQIDIVVDLGGYSDKARPKILAYRPAPLSVSYLGYPGTLGGDYVDYLIADVHTVPEDSDRHFAEKILRLPECFMPYDGTTVPAEPPARADEGLPEGKLVFANFNSTDKITPDIFDVWMRLLQTVPNSVLWLNVQNLTARRNLVAEATVRMVDVERIVFAARRTSRAEHLARLSLADLFIDTWPYNAHATASDFLAVGVPILTWKGASFASRVAASMLHSVGLSELIVDSLAEYEAEAMRLALNPGKLAQLRKYMRQRTSDDTRRLAQHIEDAYFAIWERRIRELPPQSVTILA